MRYGPIIGVTVSLLFGALLTGCGDPEPESAEQDSVSMSGPVARPGGATEVWDVRNAWSDVDTSEAQRAGVAWAESSGLNWEQKYDAWVASLEIVDRSAGGKTFAIKTPFGDKQLPAPQLDCGEVAYTLRLAFASWYHLPFYVKGWNEGTWMYGGHFGFVKSDGTAFEGFPGFRDRYADYEGEWSPGDPWPRDETLRSRRLGDDDGNEFLDGEGAGAYFDEIFLNKRAGHFARLLLLYYGSVNLASTANLYHVQADAILPGDVLLKRHKKQGTGHTVPVLKAWWPIEGRVAVEVASGNIPRRQPLWEDTLSARHRFTSNGYGGHGNNSDGDAYASLGGGLKRWRTAVLQGGRWSNVVLEQDQEAYIPDSDLERVAGRVDRFGEILLSGTPEEQLATAEALADGAREHLRKYPASCSKRTEREQALAEIYRLGGEMGMTTAELDAKYRSLEDYVLGELVYSDSKTCCWNSTTTAMYEIVMSYAEQEQAAAEANQQCVVPTVFKAENAGAEGDGYQRWRDHAFEIGRDTEWVPWSEDELCTQRGVMDDTLAESSATPWCGTD